MGLRVLGFRVLGAIKLTIGGIVRVLSGVLDGLTQLLRGSRQRELICMTAGFSAGMFSHKISAR